MQVFLISVSITDRVSFGFFEKKKKGCPGYVQVYQIPRTPLGPRPSPTLQTRNRRFFLVPSFLPSVVPDE